MKIFIVGIVASGKTTLARKLSRELIIPWYEGDCIVHREERKRQDISAQNRSSLK
jgi:adenylate kinase family enzyme